MTTIVRLTRAELRKLATARTFLITLALSVGLAVICVIATAAAAGKNGAAALGTTASTDQMLKTGVVCCVAMLVLGIIASGGEYRHKTIIPAMLVAPRRGALVIAKVIGVTVAGLVLGGLTFGLGLATAVAELSARGTYHLPADAGRLFADAVIAATLFGIIGVALGYITRSTVAAVVGAVGWVLFAEYAILRTLAPHLTKWLVTGSAVTLTSPAGAGSATLSRSPLSPSSAHTRCCCSRSPPGWCCAATWPDPPVRGGAPSARTPTRHGTGTSLAWSRPRKPDSPPPPDAPRTPHRAQPRHGHHNSDHGARQRPPKEQERQCSTWNQQRPHPPVRHSHAGSAHRPPSC